MHSGASPPATPLSARPPARLIGRDAQLSAVQRLLATERLVTIVGAGGVGKTRLALDVARRAETATVLLLAPVTDPTGVPHALAAALGLREVRGNVLAACARVRRRPAAPARRGQLRAPARGRRGRGRRPAQPVRRVDGAGHEPGTARARRRVRLPPGAASAARPGSLRELDPHRLAACRRWPSSSSAPPGSGPDSRPAPDELRLIGDIVRRLDGMPLAIELAAGRLSTFSLADLAATPRPRARPARQRSAPPRPGTGRCARPLEWSYQLLTAGAAAVPAPVDVHRRRRPDDCRGGRRRAGARRRPGDALAQLVDASMIDATFEGGDPLPHARDGPGLRA